MRTLALLIALTGVCQAGEDRAVVRFSNGDRLSGNLLSLTTESLRWKSEILTEPAEFELKQVVDLAMVPEPGAGLSEEGGHEAVLGMTNGDIIKGELAGLTDDEVRLKTWYAGELTFRRAHVRTVDITRTTKTHYRGPNSLEEWDPEGDADGWSYKEGSLVSSSAGGIAREVDFPEECKISFEAAWQGAFRPRILFYADGADTSEPGGGYEIVFQGNTVHVKKGGSNDWLGRSTKAGVLREQEKARIEIRASLKQGKILLYVDGKFIDIWEDPDVEEGNRGKGLHFITQGNSQLRISDIVVSGWDGYVGDLPENNARVIRGGRGGNRVWGRGMPRAREAEKEQEEEIETGRMKLFNGDSIKGEILGIEGGEIRLKTPFAEVNFPVHRLKNIALEPTIVTPKKEKGDVRATLADGTRMVFRLDGVEEEKLVGFSQNFGVARFSKDAFSKIEFNIYDKELEKLREYRDW